MPDVDLQVTVSEVRPDGKETYVQSGYLRTSLRKLDAKHSTLLEPVLSLRRDDAAKLPKGRLAKLIVPLYYEGHVYRASSRIRVTVSAPVGDQPVWAFDQTGAVPRRERHHRLLAETPLEADPPARPGGIGADAAAPVSRAPRRALPNFP